MWQADPNFNIVLIVALTFAFFVAIPIMIGSLIYRNSQKRREAELTKLAIEKGQPLPQFPPPTPGKYATLKHGLVWIAVGLGLIIMVLFEELFNLSGVSVGFIPLLVGIALLISWNLERKEKSENS